jgi:hypothetical protein
MLLKIFGGVYEGWKKFHFCSKSQSTWKNVSKVLEIFGQMRKKFFKLPIKSPN